MLKKLCLSSVLILVSCAAICAQTGIRKIDFRNFTFQSQCAKDEPYAVSDFDRIRLRHTMMQGPNLHWIYKIDGIFYADLNGDGREEALIASECHYPAKDDAGTVNGGEILVYTIKNAQPVLLARNEQLIDTPYIRDISAKNKMLTVTYGYEGQAPTRQLRFKYRLENGVLNLIY